MAFSFRMEQDFRVAAKLAMVFSPFSQGSGRATAGTGQSGINPRDAKARHSATRTGAKKLIKQFHSGLLNHQHPARIIQGPHIRFSRNLFARFPKFPKAAPQ